MKIKSKMTVLILLIILGSVAVFFIGSTYYQYQSYQKVLDANEGLIEACNQVPYSDDLFSTLGKLDIYTPKVFVRSNYIFLDFGNEIPDGAGVGLLFDGTYKLVDKFCSDVWEKGTRDILIVD